MIARQANNKRSKSFQTFKSVQLIVNQVLSNSSIITSNKIKCFFSFWFTQDGPALVKKIKGIYRFNVKNADGKEAWWIVDAKNGNGALKFKGTGKIFESSIVLNIRQNIECLLLGREWKYSFAASVAWRSQTTAAKETRMRLFISSFHNHYLFNGMSKK